MVAHPKSAGCSEMVSPMRSAPGMTRMEATRAHCGSGGWVGAGMRRRVSAMSLVMARERNRWSARRPLDAPRSWWVWCGDAMRWSDDAAAERRRHGLYSDPYCKMGISSAMPAPTATPPTSALTGAAGCLGGTPPPGATIAPWSLCTASTTKPCVAPGHALLLVVIEHRHVGGRYRLNAIQEVALLASLSEKGRCC
jgi:hypothetical protein